MQDPKRREAHFGQKSDVCAEEKSVVVRKEVVERK